MRLTGGRGEKYWTAHTLTDWTVQTRHGMLFYKGKLMEQALNHTYTGQKIHDIFKDAKTQSNTTLLCYKNVTIYYRH